MFARWLLTLLLLVGLAPPALATVNDVLARNQYVGNASTTVFPYTFRILIKDDIEVLKNGVVQNLDTDYSVGGVGNSAGGTVTFANPPASGNSVTLLRKQPNSQLSIYLPNEAFPATRLEKDLDKNIMVDQEQEEKLRRAPKFFKQSLFHDINIDNPVAGQCLAWENASPVTKITSGVCGGGGGGGSALSLNSQTWAAFPDQFFGNDSNVTISSSVGIHTLGWTGCLPVSRGGIGACSGTQNAIPYFDTPTSMAASILSQTGSAEITIGSGSILDQRIKADGSMSLGVSTLPEVTITTDLVAIGTVGRGTTTELLFYGATAGYVGFAAPDTVTTPYHCFLPTDPGNAGDVLTSDGGSPVCILSWTPAAGTGTVTSATGADTRIAVFTDGTNIKGYTDFTWDDTNHLFIAGPTSAIDPANTTEAAIVGSSGSTIGSVATTDTSLIGGSSGSDIGASGSFVTAAAILGSYGGLIDNGSAYAGLLGTATSSIIEGSSYVGMMGASSSGLGIDKTPGGTAPDTSATYAAMAGVSTSSIVGGAYAFIGGASASLIDATVGPGDGNYSAIIGASDAINRGTYSAIAGNSQGLIDTGASYSFIGGGQSTTIGAGCTSCAVLGDGDVDPVLTNAVAINGGHATTDATTAIGGTTEIADTIRFLGSTSGSTSFKAAATPTPTTFTLPTGDGSAGTCLSTNGSGTLGWANCSSGGTGLTSLGGQTGATQTFAKVNDTNVTLTIGSATDIHTFTMGWAGTLANTRGGTGQNTSAWSALPLVTAGTWSQYAGTGACTAGSAITALSASGVATCAAFGGTGTVTHTAGALTLNQVVVGNGGADVRTFGGADTGVFFSGASGALSQDTSFFSWDYTKHTLKLGFGGDFATQPWLSPPLFASPSAEIGFATGATGPKLTLTSTNGTIITPTASVVNNILGTVEFKGFDGTNGVQGARMYTTVQGAVTAGVIPTNISFETTDTGGAKHTPLVLRNNGNINLGGKIIAYGGLGAADGALLIGNGAGGRWDASTLTAGPGISITNGPGTIQISTAASACAGGGRVVVSGTSEEAVVTFGTPMTTATYAMASSVIPGSGAILGVPIYVKDVTVNGFTIVLSAAPGAGKSTTVAWVATPSTCTF